MRWMMVVTLLAALAGAGIVGAMVQDSDEQPESSPATSEAPAGAEETAEPSEELRTFVPTEELPADSAISFPVDI